MDNECKHNYVLLVKLATQFFIIPDLNHVFGKGQFEWVSQIIPYQLFFLILPISDEDNNVRQEGHGP